LFNHESPRRGETCVTKKITKAVAAIAKGRQETIRLGNLEAMRDWGYAKEYIEAMWLMLQQPKPEDYVIATGESHSIREFVEFAFAEVGVEIEWRGKGVDEKGFDRKSGRVRVEIDPRYFRPAEVDYLRGDSAKARDRLGWTFKTNVKELCTKMVKYDLAYDMYGCKED
jgi:GDPmannose 4,6-dehydratase